MPANPQVWTSDPEILGGTPVFVGRVYLFGLCSITWKVGNPWKNFFASFRP